MRLTRASALALLAAAAAWPLPAAAQPAPFDMSGERPARPQPQPQPQRPASPPSVSTAPSPVRPEVPASTAPASAPPASVSNTNAAPAPSTGWRRHLIAGPELALSGEIDRRRWSITLTREEAEAAAKLAIAYQNAILVAPEASRLRLLVNDVPLIDAPVASSDGLSDLTVAVPAGLLRPGLNTIGVESTLRHRTDCTVASTYELWTTLDSGRTFLEFAGSAGDFAPRRLEDVRATGLDGEGLTQIRLALPAGDLSDAAPAVLRLSQALALLTAMPNQSVEIVQGSVPPARAGTLDVVVAPGDALSALADGLSASSGGGASFLRRADGSSVLALKGSNWDEVAAGAERIVSFVDRDGAAPRPAILNPALRTPDAPLMREGGALSFRELGVLSQEFTGRRFRTEFAVAVPGDFFAEAYGEAVVRLDAAYSGEVLPGSLVNLYVNGNIATTLPIGGGGSGALDDFPLRMTMRHLRPGVNTIALEANLLTEADGSCQPGTSTGGAPRFALFDTSRLEVPDFARIARVPDLSAFQGVGFPYNVARDPVDVVLPDDRAEGLSAAATFLGRIAFSAGHAIPLRLAPAPTGALGSHALFIGPTRQLPPEALTRAHIDPARAAEWGGQAPGPAAAPALTLEGWQKQFGTASGWRATLADLESWLRETFDIEAGGLRLVPASQQPFAPREEDGLLIGQGEGPAGVWTVLTAPSTAALRDNIALVAREGNWVQLVGRVSAFDPGQGTTASQPVGAASFVPTQPFSFSNMRLILANWLSENVLAYASLIVVVALLLGIATTAFVQTLGHRE